MMYKVRLDPYYTKLKKKKGWVPCNDPHLLICALWEHNDKYRKSNITKISIPKIIPGYNIPELLLKMQQNLSESFIVPEIIVRD